MNESRQSHFRQKGFTTRTARSDASALTNRSSSHGCIMMKGDPKFKLGPLLDSQSSEKSGRPSHTPGATKVERSWSCLVVAYTKTNPQIQILIAHTFGGTKF
jgi:hypothetical protein